MTYTSKITHRMRCDYFKQCEQKRQQIEPSLMEAYRLAMWDRPWRSDVRVAPYYNPEDIWSSVTARGVRNLNTRTMRLLIPQTAPWCEITVREKLKRAKRLRARMQANLEAANLTLFEFFAQRNFYLATTEALMDAIVGGTFCIQIIDVPGRPLRYKAIPLDELYFDDNWDDQVDMVFRKHALRARQMLRRFGRTLRERLREQYRRNPADPVKLIESVIPYEGGYDYCIWIERNQEVVECQWLRQNPFIVARWQKLGGSCWGSRPVRAALPQIRMANAQNADAMAFGGFAANGLWQTTDMNVNIENVKRGLKYGGLLVVNQELKPVEFPGQYQINMQMIDRTEQQIQHLLYDQTPPSADQLKFMKAEAVIYLREQLMNQIGESALRLQREFLQIVAQQTVERLVARGDIEVLTPQELGALGYQVDVDDPERTVVYHLFQRVNPLMQVDVNAALAKLLAAQEANETATALLRVAQLVGAPQVAVHADMDKATRMLIEGYGVPSRILRDEREAARIKAQQEEFRGQNLGIQSLLQAQTGSLPEPPERETELVP